MKLIKLTSLDKKPIYINIDMIGHLFEVEATMEYGKIIEEKHTKIGVTTHNNGGFRVKESIDEILELEKGIK